MGMRRGSDGPAAPYRSGFRVGKVGENDKKYVGCVFSLPTPPLFLYLFLAFLIIIDVKRVGGVGYKLF